MRITSFAISTTTLFFLNDGRHSFIQSFQQYPLSQLHHQEPSSGTIQYDCSTTFSLSNKKEINQRFIGRSESTTTPASLSKTCLYMGAFNRRNKQADLIAKMKQAKEQKQQEGEQQVQGSSSSSTKSADEIKQMNDRRRFEELLNSEKSTVNFMNEYTDDSLKSKTQEEEELLLLASSRLSKKHRLFEGDPAPTEPFDTLIDTATENRLGSKGTTKLLPWLKISTQQNYIVVLADPRSKSSELRESIQTLETTLPIGILKNVIVINADTPIENKKLAKKLNVDKISLYSDNDQKEWMKEYTALGDKRWSMTLFVLVDGKIETLVREVDPLFISRTVSNAVKSVHKS